MNGFGRSLPLLHSIARPVTALLCMLSIASGQTHAAGEPPRFIEPDLVFVGAGNFVMGDSSGAGQADELPPHDVRMRDFFVGAKEVTRAEYSLYARDTGVSFDVGPDSSLPVTDVSWEDARSYARWLARKTRKAYRLPSEAEWEYAARAKGVHAGQYIDGNDAQTLCRWANIADESAQAAGTVREYTPCSDARAGLAPVGTFAPNAIGLRDMSGNVWEWTLDCYTPDYAKASASGKPRGGRCEQHVIRGGSFRLPAASARLSNREAFSTGLGNDQIGFRLVQEP